MNVITFARTYPVGYVGDLSRAALSHLAELGAIIMTDDQETAFHTLYRQSTASFCTQSVDRE